MSSTPTQQDLPLSITIDPPRTSNAARAPILSTIEDVDSTHSQSPTLIPTLTRPEENKSPFLSPDEDDSEEPKTHHPFSPFYNHPKTRVSILAEKSESVVNLSHVYTDSSSAASAADLEKGISANTTSDACSKTRNVLRYPSISRKLTTNTNGGDCTVWPGMTALKKRKKELKRQQGCTPWRHLSRKQKIWTKIIVAAVVVGLAIGLGLGISKAVGGGIWKSASAPNVPAS